MYLTKSSDFGRAPKFCLVCIWIPPKSWLSKLHLWHQFVRTHAICNASRQRLYNCKKDGRSAANFSVFSTNVWMPIINTPTSPTLLFWGVDHFLGETQLSKCLMAFSPISKKKSRISTPAGQCNLLQTKQKHCRVWKPPFPLKPLTASTSFQPLPGTIAAESMRAWYDRRRRGVWDLPTSQDATGWMGRCRNPARKTIPFGMFLRAVVKSMW